MIGRIQSRSDFQRIRSEGVHVRSGVLSCTMCVDASLLQPRVGYALGRAYGSAVSRNRLRRQMRALMAEREPRLAPGIYVFGASGRAKNLSYAQLGADLDRLIAKCAERSAS